MIPTVGTIPVICLTVRILDSTNDNTTTNMVCAKTWEKTCMHCSGVIMNPSSKQTVCEALTYEWMNYFLAWKSRKFCGWKHLKIQGVVLPDQAIFSQHFTGFSKSFAVTQASLCFFFSSGCILQWVCLEAIVDYTTHCFVMRKQLFLFSALCEASLALEQLVWFLLWGDPSYEENPTVAGLW